MIILLNILISLFSSAYDDVSCVSFVVSLLIVLQVVADSEAEYLAYFSGKTVGMIRAPDSYVYPAPFNLVEIFLVSPFEYVHISYNPHFSTLNGVFQVCREQANICKSTYIPPKLIDFDSRSSSNVHRSTALLCVLSSLSRLP